MVIGDLPGWTTISLAPQQVFMMATSPKRHLNPEMASLISRVHSYMGFNGEFIKALEMNKT